jgi:hypothetical protein
MRWRIFTMDILITLALLCIVGAFAYMALDAVRNAR